VNIFRVKFDGFIGATEWEQNNFKEIEKNSHAEIFEMKFQQKLSLPMIMKYCWREMKR
jgi:hypothetical protein